MAEVDRRSVLQGAAVVAGLGLVAACSDADDASSGTPSRPAASASTGPPVPAVLVALADIPVGGAVAATAPSGENVILARPTASTAVGFSAKCPHQGCTVAPGDEKLACPCHGSTFATTTGERLGGPATTGLAPFPVTVRAGNVMTA